MIDRLETRLLLRPEDLRPTDDRFEVVGVFNPGAVFWDGEVILLVRVAERPRQKIPGFTGLPRFDPDLGLVIDWVPSDELQPMDPRVVRSRTTGRIRLTSVSHLRVVFCGAGRQVREVSPTTFRPSTLLEEYGVEDPRITVLEDRCYFTYVAVSRHGPATALASTTNFQTFRRHGIIFCPENKDVVLFPERVEGRFHAIHRPVCAAPFTPPEMWIARSMDLRFWGEHSALDLGSAHDQESQGSMRRTPTGAGSQWRLGRVGAGAPPRAIAP